MSFREMRFVDAAPPAPLDSISVPICNTTRFAAAGQTTSQRSLPLSTIVRKIGNNSTPSRFDPPVTSGSSFTSQFTSSNATHSTLESYDDDSVMVLQDKKAQHYISSSDSSHGDAHSMEHVNETHHQPQKSKSMNQNHRHYSSPETTLPPPPPSSSNALSSPTLTEFATALTSFQKLIEDTQKVLSYSVESPEAAWRSRILVRSAKETDHELWSKLYDYENSLFSLPDCPEVREAQTTCYQLHRDFKTLHETLVRAIATYEQSQCPNNTDTQTSTAISTYEEVIVTADHPDPDGSSNEESAAPELDYFDRVSKQAEQERAAKSSIQNARQVYKELSNIVDVRQDAPKGQNLEDLSSRPVLPSASYVREHDPPPSRFPALTNCDPYGGGMSLCGSLEAFGDPRSWSFGIESLDLVYKENSLMLNRIDSVPIETQPPPEKTDEKNSIEISTHDDSIEVERIMMEVDGPINFVSSLMSEDSSERYDTLCSSCRVGSSSTTTGSCGSLRNMNPSEWHLGLVEIGKKVMGKSQLKKDNL